MAIIPAVPQTITVHLGSPNSSAENVTVPFLDYVANVASSEIYPTWPESAIRANMYAQVSFALNRIYTEYYRTRGYDFDITNDTAFDQYYVEGRNVFENVSQIAGELFNNYIRRVGNVEPLFAQYCDGVRTKCPGLSQWGSVELAEEGLSALEILREYYGEDIELVENAPITGSVGGAPSVPLRLGSVGDNVRTLQIRLNRISSNYPSIPKILATNGSFGEDTEAAVKKFQKIFELDPDGIVGKSTWYRVQNVYIGVKRLNDLDSEGIRLDEISEQFEGTLSVGSTGQNVRDLQYFLNFLSSYYSSIPPIAIDSVYDEETKSAVIDTQNTFGLDPDGIVGVLTWNAIYRAYRGVITTIPREYVEGVTLPYNGVPLQIGSDSDEVRLLQEYLNYISGSFEEINPVNPTGYFGAATQEAVIAFQNLVDLEPTGVVGAVTWRYLTDLYETLYQGSQLKEGQYPGYPVGGDA